MTKQHKATRSDKELVDGVKKVYTVEGHKVEVKAVRSPNSESPFLAIEEDVQGRLVYFPHAWLFKKPEHCKFSAGWLGEIQRQMLHHLQMHLAKPIHSAKMCMDEKREIEKAASGITVKQEVVRPMFTPEKVTHIWTNNCRPLKDLANPSIEGLYDLSNEDGTLVVELIHRPEGNIFIVKKISPDGFLSDRLMEGFQIEIKNIHRHHPELDQHIRGLFALNNIMLPSGEQNPQMNSASSRSRW